MQLSKIIKSLCAERGWTLSQLAKESKVAKQTLHGWTTGRSSVNPVQLKAVASALGVSLHHLCFGEPDPNESGGKEILKELFSGDVRVTLHKIERRVRP